MRLSSIYLKKYYYFKLFSHNIELKMIENVDFLSKTNLDVPKYDFQLPNTVNINEEIK